MDRALAFLGRSLAGLSDSAYASDGKTWGREMKVGAGITMALNDMHEHLGQLIAYARMNKVVERPPPHLQPARSLRKELKKSP